MKIVAVADTHLFHHDLTIPEGDVFIHAGDLCRHGSLDELRHVADWSARLPHPHKIVVAGNHDRCFVDAAGEALALLGEAMYCDNGSIDSSLFLVPRWVTISGRRAEGWMHQ